LGLRPPHEAGQRAAKRLLVELGHASMTLQELRRSAAIVGPEGGVSPDAAEPLRCLKPTPIAGAVKRSVSIAVYRVDRGAHAVQPLGDVELAFEAGGVQWGIPIVVSGVDRGTRTVQPLGYVEVTL